MLNKMIPELKIKADESAKMQKQIEIQNKEVSVIAADVKVEADKAQVEKDKAGAIEADCKEALAKVQPIYQQAVAAVDKLRSQDVDEMKGFQKPTPPVALVAQALCYFFKVPPIKIRAQTAKESDTFDYWTPCKKNILNARLLTNLKNYAKDTVT